MEVCELFLSFLLSHFFPKLNGENEFDLFYSEEQSDKGEHPTIAGFNQTWYSDRNRNRCPVAPRCFLRHKNLPNSYHDVQPRLKNDCPFILYSLQKPGEADALGRASVSKSE